MEKVMGWMMLALILVLLVLPWLAIVAVPVALLFGISLIPLALLRWNAGPLLSRQARWSVLVADDDDIAIGPLLAALGDRAVDISFASDGIAALKALREKKFDLLILDLMMPGLNGDHVLRTREKDLDEEVSTPVIYFTGFPDRELQLRSENFKKFHVDDVWLKNMPFKKLKLKLDEAFFIAS